MFEKKKKTEQCHSISYCSADECEDHLLQDAALVRLALHALHGVKTSLDEIEELSILFSSSPADMTSHRVANVW